MSEQPELMVARIPPCAVAIHAFSNLVLVSLYYMELLDAVKTLFLGLSGCIRDYWSMMAGAVALAGWPDLSLTGGRDSQVWNAGVLTTGLTVSCIGAPMEDKSAKKSSI